YGDLRFADQLEKIAFNALPAYFTRDMWAHQYNQQVNQVACVVDDAMPWCTNDADANIYGLMPHFGCCTSNYHQGLPKFVAHAWLQNTNELVAVSYIPLAFQTEVNGTAISVFCDSTYPFSSDVNVTLECVQPVEFTLRLRIPQWSADTVICVNGETVSIGARTEVALTRVWQGKQQITLSFSFQLQQEQRFNQAVTLSYGPLVYALPLAEEWQQINQDKPYREAPHCDYSVHPASPWNWAINPVSAQWHSGTLTSVPFSRETPPASLTVEAVALAQWQSESACLAGELPVSPVMVNAPVKTLTLIPFGCTHLRMTELPWYQAHVTG
ncbi:hypothetical protein, partial [Plesiomonas sp.]|uniref:hypothetical protein n=1 Tax=Plesiomonas sp. TaxID=2486279 RepID=UPI003F2EEF27